MNKRRGSFYRSLKFSQPFFPTQQTAPGSSRMLWSLFRKFSSVGNFLCHLSPTTRSGQCVAVHVIGVKVQDFNYIFFVIIFLPPTLQGDTSTDSIFDKTCSPATTCTGAPLFSRATRAFLCWTCTASESHPL